MDTAAAFKELQELLPQCLLKDHLRIGSRVSRWLRQHRPGPGTDAAVEDWLREARESAALRARRQAQLPPITYPLELPVSMRREEIIAALRQHQVLVIAGETGSGKTTQLPKMCLEAGLGIRARIGCTQPRRVAAQAVSRRLSEELGLRWGREIGCKIRFADHTSPETCIKFMTDGMLLAEVQADPLLTEYEAIILDEAHERSLNIDFLLGCLKQLVAKRPDLKLIITSATIDTQAFSQAFNQAPIIEVSGRLYPVQLIYAPLDEAAEAAGDITYVDAAVNAVENILIESSRGDVLVFMPGERDILETRDALVDRRMGELELIPLFGRLSPAEQTRIFAPSARRKIVIATNIAETSLTVPGIRYVVDTGLARISRYHPHTRTRRLPIEPVSQSSANQRKGRCGRVAEGVCIRLYSEEDFQARPLYTQPEIQRANLAEVILRLKSARLGDIETFPFLNPPVPAAIQGGYQLLHELGALDEQRELTELGRELARLPVDPTIGRMILQARHEAALPEVLIIAAGLSIQDPRERPLERQAEADTAHRRFRNPRSDFLTLLNIWHGFHDQLEACRTQNQARKFCRSHFLSYLRMREWRDVHAQLEEVMEEMETPPSGTAPASYEAIHRSILTGLWSQVSLRKERNLFQLGGNREVMLFPGSGLFQRAEEKNRKPAEAAKKPAIPTAPPKWLMAGEIVETSRLFLRTVAEIDTAWILQLAPHLCRRTYLEPHWSASAGRVLAREKVTLNGLVVQDSMVPYGPVNPEEATQIFLRTALVEEGLADHFNRQPGRPLVAAPAARPGAGKGGRISQEELTEALAEAKDGEERDLTRLPSPYRFLEHNHQLRHKIELWQTRLPHRVVPDLEEALFQAYVIHLGKLSSVGELNRVLRDQSATTGFLCFQAADLLGEHAAAFNANAFPDSIAVGSQAVPLRYAYAPGEAQDGFTVRLPFNLAQMIEPGALDWAVPGLREAQILHLLQALPKGLRRMLMPLPPKARELALSVPANEADYLATLIQCIHQRHGVVIPRDTWQADHLPPHLRPRYEILDHNQKSVAQGRDLQALRQEIDRHDTTTESDIWLKAAQQWERYSLADWTCGDLPERILVAEVSGFPLHAFPGLRLEAEEISLRLFRKEEEALAAHAVAVPRLLERVLQRDLGWLQKDLRALAKWRPLYVTLGTGEELEETGFENLRQHLLGPRPTWPRTQAAFAALAQEIRGQLPGLSNRLHTVLGEILQGRQNLLVYRQPYPQMLADLNRLLPRQFLRQIPFARLPHLPRYLKALQIRAERAGVNPLKDQEKHQRIQPYLEAFTRLDTRAMSPGAAAGWHQCRWLLEEYKVSLFAQELGTSETVSPRKIEEALARASGKPGPG